MPVFLRDQIRIYYEVQGDGFPILSFAPGGLLSSIPYWQHMPWGPADLLSSEYQVISMDQRNAGQSTAPVTPDDGWEGYTADHIALLDHLGIERCHVFGSCIGGSFILRLIEAAPDRVASAVLMQPIGSSVENRTPYKQMFTDWAAGLKDANPHMSESDWDAVYTRVFGGDFTFSVTPDFVRTVQTPLLVLMGNDLLHPQATSREIADLAQNAELVEHWKQPEYVASGQQVVIEFLRRTTP